jgi:hypothetical protein
MARAYLRRMPKVGISGSYGGFNLGDEAILQVIISELRRSFPVEVTVFSRDPEDTKRRHAIERAVQPRELSRRETQEIIADLDLFILGGGGILYDADADMYLREVLLAHEAETPVMVYAISAGPLVDLPLRARVRDALNRASVGAETSVPKPDRRHRKEPFVRERRTEVLIVGGGLGRRDQLDRRPAHRPSRSARRASVDRGHRLHRDIPAAAAWDPRLLPNAITRSCRMRASTRISTQVEAG